jgi:hypothetical protein
MVTNLHIITHIDILAERTAFASLGSRLDMAEMPYFRPFAYAHVVVNVTAFVYVIFAHSNMLL